MADIEDIDSLDDSLDAIELLALLEQDNVSEGPTEYVDLDEHAFSVAGARVLDSKKGDDVVILDVGAVLSVVGCFVIASAPNSRLVSSLADEVRDQLKGLTGRLPLRTEGLSHGQWVLLDYGDVVFHLFLEEVRRNYDLERLWRDVPRVNWQVK